MRMMLRVTIPAARGSAAIKDGTLQKAIEATMSQVKPECAYFNLNHGQRNATFVFNLEKESDIPTILEPLWAALEAEIDLQPVLTFDDLATAMQALG